MWEAPLPRQSRSLLLWTEFKIAQRAGYVTVKFAFEVKESDLMGRVGTLKVGRHSLETPCLFPVIHPVVQAVSTAELSGMGFQGLMTNSYIIYSRRKEEALAKGVHELVNFDGAIMTDSGGYQVLEYGDLGLGYGEVASFQDKIGSDLAVTLDRPTGYSESRRYARETMEHSLKGAVGTIEQFGDSRTVWIGPVQGGLFTDLLKRSAAALIRAGFEFLALGSPTQVMENYRFEELVKMIAATRKAMPYSVPLHLFGAGHPLTMPLAIALGCDTFDSASYILFARRESYMTERGVVALRSMKFLPCSCEVCSRTSVTELFELEDGDRVKRLAAHNLWLLRKEVETCKEAIVEGRLWDLVQEKASAHPRLYEALAGFQRETKLLREGTAAMKERGLLLRTEADLSRPEIDLARQKLGAATKRRAKKAVLLTFAAPPAGRVRVQKRNHPKEEQDLYRLHPILGPYPAELDFVYPFTQIVAARELPKATQKDAVRSLRKIGYSSVRVAGERERGAILGASLRNRRRPKAASPSARSS